MHKYALFNIRLNYCTINANWACQNHSKYKAILGCPDPVPNSNIWFWAFLFKERQISFEQKIKTSVGPGTYTHMYIFVPPAFYITIVIR